MSRADSNSIPSSESSLPYQRSSLCSLLQHFPDHSVIIDPNLRKKSVCVIRKAYCDTKAQANTQTRTGAHTDTSTQVHTDTHCESTVQHPTPTTQNTAPRTHKQLMNEQNERNDQMRLRLKGLLPRDSWMQWLRFQSSCL